MLLQVREQSWRQRLQTFSLNPALVRLTISKLCQMIHKLQKRCLNPIDNFGFVIKKLYQHRIAQWQSACPRTKKFAVQASDTASCFFSLQPLVIYSACKHDTRPSVRYLMRVGKVWGWLASHYWDLKLNLRLQNNQ